MEITPNLILKVIVAFRDYNERQFAKRQIFLTKKNLHQKNLKIDLTTFYLNFNQGAIHKGRLL